MKSGIYKITNTVTNDVYVGATKNLAVRFCTHRSALRRKTHHNKLLREDSIKYGFEAFELEVIEKCPNDKLYEREQHYISELNPKYNLLKENLNRATKRILCDVSEEFYIEIKMLALKSRMSLKKYMMRAIMEQIIIDKKIHLIRDKNQ